MAVIDENMVDIAEVKSVVDDVGAPRARILVRWRSSEQSGKPWKGDDVRIVGPTAGRSYHKGKRITWVGLAIVAKARVGCVDPVVRSPRVEPCEIDPVSSADLRSML
jgi:hypothetical protein